MKIAVTSKKPNDQLEPTVFVIFGGAGDLTWRKLVPALFDLSAMEKLHIRKVLKYTSGNKAEAARLLNIGLATLYRKIEEYGLKSLFSHFENVLSCFDSILNNHCNLPIP